MAAFSSIFNEFVGSVFAPFLHSPMAAEACYLAAEFYSAFIGNRRKIEQFNR